MSTVVILGINLDPWMLFASRALALNGVLNQITFLRPEDHIVDGDEEDCIKWLSACSDINAHVASRHESRASSCDLAMVIVRGAATFEDRQWLAAMAAGARRRVAVLRFAPDSWNWQLRQLAKEIRSPFFRKFNDVWTEDSHLRVFRLLLRKPHRFFGALPHQRCSVLQGFWNLLNSEPPYGPRSFLFSFAGAVAPARDPIANWIELRLVESGRAINLGVDHGGNHRVIWHYDRPGCQRPRPYEGYLRELESSWFCLCLPGYTRTTNRVLEAVLRGCIPVIEEDQVPFHRLPLKDEENAVFVRNGNWDDAILRIAAISQSQRLVMQQAVLELVRTSASLPTISRRLVKELMGERTER